MKAKRCNCGKNRRGTKISCFSDICPCKKNESPCTRDCRCHNCRNVNHISNTSGRENGMDETAFIQKEKRKEFMEDQKASISSGTWRNLETFCLIVCREVLLSHSISENPGNLKLLYNFVAQSDSVKAMLLPISVKSTSQIAAKIAYLSKFHEI